MNYTAFGTALAKAEPLPTLGTGAGAHVQAIAYDAGISVLLTGKDANGKTFRRTAKSVLGAHATALAAWGIRRAWLVQADGTRKLIFSR